MEFFPVSAADSKKKKYGGVVKFGTVCKIGQMPKKGNI